MVITLILVMLTTQPAWAWAATPQSDRMLLTLEELQERLKNPISQDGRLLIDLQNFTIDLRPENAEFRDRFYPLLQTAMNQSKERVGLNLSRSLIRGKFIGNRLGVRIPVLKETLESIFLPDELAELTSNLAQLLVQDQLTEKAAVTLPKITVIRGQIQLSQTRFEGEVNFKQTFFLQGINAEQADFVQPTDWRESRFSQTVNFSQAIFEQTANFQRTVFLTKARFRQVTFKNPVDFEDSQFQEADFNEAHFQKIADFKTTLWQDEADFSESWWQGRAVFSKSRFIHSTSLQQALFEQSLDFRGAQFRQELSLKEASIQELVDFSYVSVSRPGSLNLANLTFDSTSAQILGDPGFIGQAISVPSLQDNENLLRNLIRNFRQQEQIEDANQIELLRAKLSLKALKRSILGVNLNTAPLSQLISAGFSAEQAQIILQARTDQPFRNLTEILKLNSIDLATYLDVYDHVIVNPRKTLQNNKAQIGFLKVYFLPLISLILTSLQWLSLSVLLLLSGYGTQFGLVFGVGILAIAYFGVLFWAVDRCRKRRPKPIWPTPLESLAISISFSMFLALGLIEVFSTSPQPWLTLAYMGSILLPLPVSLLGLLYWQGRYHNLMNVSYLTEDASLRQLRLMIGRLPVMPRYPLFRERYMPILWERRWNWLNYYDFSLNNFLKFGFNDLRLRDEYLPGLVTILVWYQWGLGVLYLSLLLWTLSRTIPGLNLLIYLK
ncbi:MAG: pentapeptide repeat-containing protein [Microcoleaceae cyanobacterium]